MQLLKQILQELSTAFSGKPLLLPLLLKKFQSFSLSLPLLLKPALPCIRLQAIQEFLLLRHILIPFSNPQKIHRINSKFREEVFIKVIFQLKFMKLLNKINSGWGLSNLENKINFLNSRKTDLRRKLNETQRGLNMVADSEEEAIKIQQQINNLTVELEKTEEEIKILSFQSQNLKEKFYSKTN